MSNAISSVSIKHPFLVLASMLKAFEFGSSSAEKKRFCRWNELFGVSTSFLIKFTYMNTQHLRTMNKIEEYFRKLKCNMNHNATKRPFGHLDVNVEKQYKSRKIM